MYPCRLADLSEGQISVERIRRIFRRAFGENPEEETFAIRFSNRTLFALLLPLIAEQFLSILMGIVDTVMVSSLGDATVSGVSLVDMVFILFINIFNALATGGAVIASRYIGAKRPEDACRSAGTLFLISLSASLLMLGAVAVLDVRLLRLLFGSAEDDVLAAAATYMRVTMISFPFVTPCMPMAMPASPNGVSGSSSRLELIM